MANNEKTGTEVPQGDQPAAPTNVEPSAHPPAQPGDGTAAVEKDVETASAVEKELSFVEEGYMKNEGRLPSPEERIDALGIPNWRELEKKIVRRLDMTLMPCLWVLYFFNYMDRASIGQARLSSLDADLNLTGSNFSTAVSILSLGYGKSLFKQGAMCTCRTQTDPPL